jgi:uncharacterized membrane protein YqiK
MPLWQLAILAQLAVLILLIAGRTAVFIPNDSFGVVERRWSLKPAPQTANFMALNGGAGFLPATIKGGWHAFFPFQYRVHRQKLITIRSIGYLFARTGAPLAARCPRKRRPERPAAPHPARRHLRHQHRPLRRPHG